MLLQKYLYNTEKDLGGCVGKISQRGIRYMAGQDHKQEQEIYKLSHWYNKTKDIERSYINVKVIRFFKKYFIKELLPKTFNINNQKRLVEIQQELLETFPKGISMTKGWVGEQCTKVGYWIWNGYTEEEAKQKVFDVQSKNGFKKSKKVKANPEKYLNTFSTNINYWINKGFNIEEAKLKLKERQATFTLEKCISKYGKEKGIERFNERQRKWQETLNSKTQEEVEAINRRKSTTKTVNNEDYKHYIKRMKKINKFLYLDNDDPYYFYINEYKNRPYFRGSVSPEIYIKFHVNEKIKKFIELKKLINEIKIFYNKGTYVKTGYGCQLKVEEGLLRSIAEIECYYYLKENNINFEIEKKYNNSKMKDDFYLTDYNIHIEIAGMMHDKEYYNKMMLKEKELKALIIENKEFEKIEQRIKIEKSKNNL